MRQLLGAFLLFSVCLLSTVGFLAQAQEPAKPAAQKAQPAPVFRAASELKWTDVPEAKGVQLATVWGNPQKGAHGAFAKFAAGTQLPLHTHTAGGRTVVVSGTLVVGFEGQSPKEMGPGSYIFFPGGARHTTGCRAGADCVFFMHWLGAFDLKPAEEKK